MMMAAFKARCPFEIGDKITLVLDSDEQQTRMRLKKCTITDIACVHYIKTGKIEFRYELDDSKKYITLGTPPFPKTE